MSANPELETNVAADSTATAPTDVEQSAAENGVEVQSPEFQNFTPRDAGDQSQEISRFADIKVNVSAELGRTQVSIETLLSMGAGSVLELDRSIDSPVELIAQGVPLACGEVVVVDGCFGIRITQVYPRNRKGETLAGESD